MERHECFAAVWLQLGCELRIQFLQLCCVISGVVCVTVAAAGVGCDQAVTDVLNLFGGAHGIQPDVGVIFTVAVSMPMIVVIILMVIGLMIMVIVIIVMCLVLMTIALIILITARVKIDG